MPGAGSNHLTIAEAVSPVQVAECLAIRRQVFIEGQSVPEARELRDEGAACRHFYVKADGQAVAAMRVMCETGNAKLQRMAVLTPHRNKGIGRAMLNFVLHTLTAEKQVESAILGAQKHAVSFYEAAGFTLIGEPFEDAGMTHYLMEKTL